MPPPAAKMAWFLGWWASKSNRPPLIPGVDFHGPMDCSDSAKVVWTKAVLDAAAEGGVCTGAVEPCHVNIMPKVAWKLLWRMILHKRCFAAAVDKGMQEL